MCLQYVDSLVNFTNGISWTRVYSGSTLNPTGRGHQQRVHPSGRSNVLHGIGVAVLRGCSGVVIRVLAFHAARGHGPVDSLSKNPLASPIPILVVDASMIPKNY